MIRGIAEVTPYLYISSANSACNQREVDRKDISFIVNATKNIGKQRFACVRVVRIPVNDEPGVNLYSYFDYVADLIYNNTLKHVKTLVHCKAGVSRSAALCIAYLMKYHRMTLKDAHDYLKRRRPIIRPNVSFWRQLIDYEYSLLRHNTVEMRMSPVGEVPDLYYNQVKNLCFVR